MNKVVIIAGAALLAACAGSGNPNPEKISLTYQTQLDSGNAAYRRGDFEESAKYYYQATKTQPEDLSGWYGVYMAESRLGNTEAANKARDIVAKAAPDMPLTQHPTAADHPVTTDAPKNPHVPQGESGKTPLPIDSIRAAKEKT